MTTILASRLVCRFVAPKNATAMRKLLRRSEMFRMFSQGDMDRFRELQQARKRTLLHRHSEMFRTFSEGDRDRYREQQQSRRRTLKEQALAPAEGNFSMGRGALAGASLVGLGALCYYGLGLSNEAGAFEKSMIWPQYIKDRIHTTYMYMGSSLILTAASAMASFGSPGIMRLVITNGFLGFALSLLAIMGTGTLCQIIEYREGFGPKQFAWLLHVGTMGAMLAPMCILGGPVLIRAAWYTTGVIGGLSMVALCAPSEKFLMMRAPLAMGLGVVFAASLGNMILPPWTALGAGLYSISLYGGLILFGLFLLHDTQRIIIIAERYPASPELHGLPPYDPINAALALYLDALNIFIRIATIVAGGGGSKRKRR